MLKIANIEIASIGTMKDQGYKMVIYLPELTPEETAFLFQYKKEGVVNSITIE